MNESIQIFSNALIRFLDGFTSARSENFSKNGYGEFVRNDCKSALREIVGPPFTVETSVGKGRWTDVPWLAVFHPLETNSAQSGFYVVYLLNSKLNTIALSLNQGVKGAEQEVGSGKKCCDLLSSRAQILYSRVGHVPKTLRDLDIELSNPFGPGRGYEAAHTLGKTYTRDDLTDLSMLQKDLREMLAIYKKLVTKNGYLVTDDNDLVEFPRVKETKKSSLHKRYDRLGNASKKVKKTKGYVCEACGFNFEDAYGELGREYIEAHHLVPLADLEEDQSRSLDIVNDFAVLCANCHRMIHRQVDPSDLALLKQSINKK